MDAVDREAHEMFMKDAVDSLQEALHIDRAEKVIEKLKEKLPDIEITGWDERLSTAAVERALIEGDVRRDKRKGVIDKLAASYILQGWLERQGQALHP